MYVLAQANTFLTSTNAAVMAHMVQLTAYMGYMQVQLKKLSSTTTKKNGDITAGAAAENSNTGVNTDPPIRPAIKTNPTTRIK